MTQKLRVAAVLVGALTLLGTVAQAQGRIHEVGV